MSETIFSADGVTSLVFSVNPSYPGRLMLDSGRVRATTEGGEDRLYKKGTACAVHTLRFEGLPASDFDGGFDYVAGIQAAGTQSLAGWFFLVASDGSEFMYSDPFGGEHVVTLADSGLDFSLTDLGLYDGTIRLRERVG